MTAVMEPTAPDGECLMFWYYMEGNGVGELSVYLQTTDKNSRTAPLWIRKGDQGRHWRHGRVTLLSPNSPYQVPVGVKTDISFIYIYCTFKRPSYVEVTQVI